MNTVGLIKIKKMHKTVYLPAQGDAGNMPGSSIYTHAPDSSEVPIIYATFTFSFEKNQHLRSKQQKQTSCVRSRNPLSRLRDPLCSRARPSLQACTPEIHLIHVSNDLPTCL